MTDEEVLECKKALYRSHPVATSCLSKMAFQAQRDSGMKAEIQRLLPETVRTGNPAALLGAAMALRSGQYKDEERLDLEIAERAQRIIASDPGSQASESAKLILGYQKAVKVYEDATKN